LKLNFTEYRPRKIDYILLLLTILAITNYNIIVAKVIGVIFTVSSIYFIFSKNLRGYFIILLLNSYNSNGFGVYNLDLLGFSPIYFTHLLLIITHFRFIRLGKKLIYYFPLIIFFPLYIIFGYYNKWDQIYFLKDLLRFSVFFSSLFVFSSNNIRTIFFESLLKYFIYLFPLLLIITAVLSPSIVLGQEKNAFFDELNSLFIILIFSIIYSIKIKNSILYWILFILLVVLKMSFFYFASIEILALIILVLILTLKKTKSFINLIKSIIFLLLLSVLAYSILPLIPGFTLFKFVQLSDILIIFINNSDNPLLFMPFSPKIRILELMNSYAGLSSKSLLHLIFGDGFGSFFQLHYYPVEDYGIPTLYNTGSYSDYEIQQNKFFTAHNTFSFIISKMGLLSVFVFLRIFVINIIKYIKNDTTNDPVIPVFSIYIIMNLGYGIKNFIVIAFMICYLIYERKKTAL